MATRLKQRRGTAAEWAAQNPVLADGEIGFEKDTLILKIGDGVTAWNDLVPGHYTRSQTDAAFSPLVHTHNYAASGHTHAPEAHDHLDKVAKAGDTMTGALTMSGQQIISPLLEKARERQSADITGAFTFDGAAAGSSTVMRSTGTGARTWSYSNLPTASAGQAASTFVIYCTAAHAITFSGTAWRFTSGIPSWTGACVITITLVAAVAIVSFAPLTTS